MPTYGNRARVSTATLGPGTLAVGVAVTGYQTFAAAGVGDGDTISYVIEDGDDWEIGTGVYNAGLLTMTRTVTESSNSDAALNLTGNAQVFIDVPATYFNAAEDYGLITSATSATDDYGSI